MTRFTPDTYKSKAFSREMLDMFRFQGDPLADPVIELMLEKHGPRAVSCYFQTMIETGIIDTDNIKLRGKDGITLLSIDPEIRAGLVRFLDETSRLPDWADPSLIKIGQQVFERNGAIAFSLLGCSSLPQLYTCGKGGTQILKTTHNLEDHVNRRILETSQFIIDTMQCGGLDPGGHGIHSIQRVRLMHTCIRQLILFHWRDGQDAFERGEAKTYGDVLLHEIWREEWGIPMGQEYMGGTLMTFSYTIIKGLEAVDVTLSDEEVLAYIHSWNVIGHIMGVDEFFTSRVTTLNEAEDLFRAVIGGNKSTTEEEAREGVKLTHALIQYMAEMANGASWWGRILHLDHIPKSLMMLFCGKDVCHLLGVKLDLFDYLAILPMKIFYATMGWLMKRLGKTHSVNDYLFKLFAEQLLAAERAGLRPPYSIPHHLRHNWKLRPDRKRRPSKAKVKLA